MSSSSLGRRAISCNHQASKGAVNTQQLTNVNSIRDDQKLLVMVGCVNKDHRFYRPN